MANLKQIPRAIIYLSLVQTNVEPWRWGLMVSYHGMFDFMNQIILKNWREGLGSWLTSLYPI